MNERINELALRAYNNSGQPTPESLSAFMQVYSEKFAELIINDARLVLCSEAFNRGNSTEAKAILTASVKVKEHFGIEL